MVDLKELYRGQKLYYKNTGQPCWFIRILSEVDRVLIMHVELYGPLKHDEPAYEREKLTEYHISHFQGSRAIFTTR